MRFQGAVVREQGQTFAIVIVKPHIVQSTHQANESIGSFQRVFPQMPVVLMAQDSRGVPTYFGRRDIAKFLSNVPMEAIPWKEYSLN